MASIGIAYDGGTLLLSGMTDARESANLDMIYVKNTIGDGAGPSVGA